MVGLFQQFGWQELILVLFIAMLLFGAKRLPEIGRSLGRSMREFKDATKGLADDVKSGLDDDQPGKASVQNNGSVDTSRSAERRND